MTGGISSELIEKALNSICHKYKIIGHILVTHQLKTTNIIANNQDADDAKLLEFIKISTSYIERVNARFGLESVLDGKLSREPQPATIESPVLRHLNH